MAHHFDTGFSVRIPSWHGLAAVLADYPEDWAAAREAAGLLWEPAEELIYRRVRGVFGAEDELPAGAFRVRGGAVMVPMTDHKLIKRDDTGAALSVQRTDYPIIAHRTMGEVLDDVAREAGSAFRFETAGSLQGGRKVWALARLDEPFQVPGDSSLTYPYLAMQNSHDGQGACRIIPTLVRIICANTWRAADGDAERHGFEVVIRHVGNVAERIEDAKATLRGAHLAAASHAATMVELTGYRYDDAVLATFLEVMFPTPEGGTERLIEDRATKRQLCRAMLTESPTLAELPDTAYKLVQLAGEYVDHLRKLPADPARRADVYLRRTMFHEGEGAKVKAGTITLARELCAAGV